MGYTVADCFKAFRAQCTLDKNFIMDIVNNYPSQVMICGRHLLDKAVRWSYTVPPDRIYDDDEFIEFIAGNGFKVVEVKAGCYHVYPLVNNEVIAHEGIHN